MAENVMPGKPTVMTTWLVEYAPYLQKIDGKDREIPCFRIFPENAPEKWIAETNSALPRDIQEENAQIMADALSHVFG